MPEIDDLMIKCPLKQDFREKFWLPYVEKLAKKPINYLTLYCPPAMDVRYFYDKGLIEFRDGVYQGVVGVTWNEKGYVKTLNNLEGRLEKFKIGKINDFLREKDKELSDKFPFDVINLDYCNHLVQNYVSDNLEDIERVVSLQKDRNCNQFVLFITTRTDKNAKNKCGFPPNFIKMLEQRIELNISKVPSFKVKYNSLFNSRKPSSDEFLVIGIVKFISNILAEKEYFIKDCSAGWLVRNNNKPEIELLHLAFLVSLKTTYRKKCFYEYGGGRVYLESSAVRILDQIIDKKIYALTEKDDKAKLERIYGTYLTRLKETNFELSIPSPLEQSS